MKKIFVLSFLLLFLTSLCYATDWYVSPTGAGNKDGTSQANAWAGFDDLDDETDGDGWSDIQPGDTLYMLDGTYTSSGANAVIDPPDNFDGSATGGYITIKALNDGKVTINGEGARKAVYLYQNDYIILKGFNAHNSDDVVIDISDCEHVQIKRVIAWDAPGNTTHSVFSIHNGCNTVLVEDCAAFGKGRKGFEPMSSNSSNGGGNITFRRCFARWEQCDYTGPKMAISACYNSDNVIVENCIATWDNQMGSSPSEARGCFSVDAGGTSTKILGSICFFLSSQNFYGSLYGFHYNDDNIEVKDCVFYNSDTSHSHRGIYIVTDTADSDTVEDCTAVGAQDSDYGNIHVYNISYPATDILSIDAQTGCGNCDRIDYACMYNNTTDCASGSVTNKITSNPQLTRFGRNILQADRSPVVDNEGSGGDTIGAVIRYRYVDGSLTSTLLWPWPMNQRIIDAMKQAGKAPIDVTRTVFELGGGTCPQVLYLNKGCDGSLTKACLNGKEVYQW